MSGPIRPRAGVRLLATIAITAALALAGCGGSSSSGSSVSAASYVKSVCGAASTWYQSVKSASTKLESVAHSTKSLTTTKSAYVSFVNSLLSATSQAESKLQSAGTPSVSGGKLISSELVHAFGLTKKGLSAAAAAAQKAPTSSPAAFERVAGGVQQTVNRALASLSAISPQHNAALRSAAKKDPTCRQLSSLG